MADLSTLRSEIDEIDELLIRLLKNRFILSKSVGAYKKTNNIDVLDNNREKEILLKIEEIVNDQELSNIIKELYQEMMLLSKKLQK